jgi:hypothetical protein
VAASLFGAPAGADAAGWSLQFASPPKVEATEAHVGVDADGNVTAVWRNDPDITNATGTLTIATALLGAGGSAYGPPLPVEAAAGAGSPRVGVTANGAAVAVWERSVSGKDIIEGATRTLGVWNGATELTDGGDGTADYLVMDLAANGEGIVGWRVDGSPRKNKVRIIGGGNFAPPPGKAFDTSPYPGNNEPDVAVSPDGSRRFLIGHKFDLGNTRLNLYNYGALGWDTGTEIASPSMVPQVAVAPNGEPVSAWLESNVLRIKRGNSEPISVANIGGLALLDLAVGPPTEEFPNGMALVTWRQFVDDGTHTCCYQARAAVGDGFSMGAPIELSDELEDVGNNPAVQAAVGPDGTAYAAWIRFDGSNWVPQASVRPVGGAFPAIAEDIGDGDAVVRDIATGADGRAVIAIDESESEGVEVYFRAATAIFTPPPPPPGTKPPLPGAPVPIPPATPPGRIQDTTPPKLRVNLSRKGFAPGDKLNQVAVAGGDPSYVEKAVRGAVKEGTRLLVELDEPATLLIRVDKLGCFTSSPGNPGRSVSGQCFRPDPDVQHLRTAGKAGLNKIDYLGDWAGARVKPGALYEFEVVATDKAGNSTRPARVRFHLDGKPGARGF